MTLALTISVIGAVVLGFVFYTTKMSIFSFAVIMVLIALFGLFLFYKYKSDSQKKNDNEEVLKKPDNKIEAVRNQISDIKARRGLK